MVALLSVFAWRYQVVKWWEQDRIRTHGTARASPRNIPLFSIHWDQVYILHTPLLTGLPCGLERYCRRDARPWPAADSAPESNSGASGGARPRIPAWSAQEDHPMARIAKARSIASRQPATPVAPEPTQAPPTQRPSGKLGVIIDRLAGKNGATADELVAATGWQRHSVLGALSRLRARGFTMRFDSHADRKAYRLNDAAKPRAQSRRRG